MENLLIERSPTSAELYALERDARRLRAAEMARLLRAFAASWRTLWAPKVVKGLRHA